MIGTSGTRSLRGERSCSTRIDHLRGDRREWNRNAVGATLPFRWERSRDCVCWASSGSYRSARLIADTSALNEAATIDESIPTPQSTVSSTAHST